MIISWAVWPALFFSESLWYLPHDILHTLQDFGGFMEMNKIAAFQGENVLVITNGHFKAYLWWSWRNYVRKEDVQRLLKNQWFGHLGRGIQPYTVDFCVFEDESVSSHTRLVAQLDLNLKEIVLMKPITMYANKRGGKKAKRKSKACCYTK